MPLFLKEENPHFQLAVWRITEPFSFFGKHFRNVPPITNESRKLQWCASRFLIKNELGQPENVLSNEIGKPVFSDVDHHVSISHSNEFAAAIVGKTVEVGIDVEPIHERVERIASKFLSTPELEAIENANRVEQLILYWSAKETLYKLHGLGCIDFKTQLIVSAFKLETQGKLTASIKTPNRSFCNLTIEYQFFENHVLTYVVV